MKPLLVSTWSMRDQRPWRGPPPLGGPGRSANRTRPPRPRRTSPHRARAGTARGPGGVEVAHREGRSLVHGRPGTLAEHPEVAPPADGALDRLLGVHGQQPERHDGRHPDVESSVAEGQRQDLVDREAGEHHRSLRAVCAVARRGGAAASRGRARARAVFSSGVTSWRTSTSTWWEVAVRTTVAASPCPNSRLALITTRSARPPPPTYSGLNQYTWAATPTAEATTAASTQPRCCAPRRSSRLMASVTTNPSTAYDANAAAMVGHDRLVTTKRIAVRPNRPTQGQRHHDREGDPAESAHARRLGRGRVRRGTPRARRRVPR